MPDNILHTRLKALAGDSINSIEVPVDLRKHSVKDEQENEIGLIEDLLYDIQSKKVRYVLIRLKNSSENNYPERILAPVGTVDPGPESNTVTIAALSDDLIKALPEYMEGQVNPGVENMIRLAFAGESLDAGGAGLTGNDRLNENEDFYGHFHFDTANLSKTRKDIALKIINGLFDDSLEAENAITALMSNGFSKDDIELSSSKISEEDTVSNHPGKYNLEASKSGSMVTVRTRTGEEALKVSIILDKNGSVSIFEHKE